MKASVLVLQLQFPSLKVTTCIIVVFQSLLQDILSHQRIVDSVVEKAQGVLQSTSNPNVSTFITNISSRYEALANQAKVSPRMHSSIHAATQIQLSFTKTGITKEPAFVV